MLTCTRFISGLVVAATLLSLTACQKPSATSSTDPVAIASFDLIQQRILTPSCATSGCHASEQDGTFAQHGLVLAEGVAYQNLVGVDPKNTDAKSDGLKRVKAYASLESLFYHKLNIAASHHAGKQYGNPMPLGGQSLSNGQIEFVRQWIDAGAPKTTSVASTTLLDDKTIASSTFVSLPVPSAGTGVQLTIPAFDVQPNFERELFTRKAIGNPQDIYVNRFQINMRSGSHHFIAYNFRDKTPSLLPTLNDVRDLRNPDNSLNLLTVVSMSNHVFMAGSQSPQQDYTFPAGTALLIPAGTSLDLNAHYVNKTTTVMKGEAQINLYSVDKAAVQRVVQTLDLSNTSLTIPANGRVTLTKAFTFAKPIKVLALTSHTHKTGEKFVIRINGGPRNGEIVYTSTDWESPELTTFKTPIDLQKGEGLTSEITYNNPTSKVLHFGLTSEDEMGIIFGYFYEE